MTDLLPTSIPDADEIGALGDLHAIDFMSKGHMPADATVILGSLGIVLEETDQ